MLRRHLQLVNAHRLKLHPSSFPPWPDEVKLRTSESGCPIDDLTFTCLLGNVDLEELVITSFQFRA